MSKSQAQAQADRRGDFRVVRAPDRRSVTVTIEGPRDGAGRETSAGSLSVAFAASDFDRIVKQCAFVNAGLDHGK